MTIFERWIASSMFADSVILTRKATKPIDNVYKPTLGCLTIFNCLQKLQDIPHPRLQCTHLLRQHKVPVWETEICVAQLEVSQKLLSSDTKTSVPK